MVNRGYRGSVIVMVTREEVNMMGLVVLRVWLVMMNRPGERCYSRTEGWWIWTLGVKVVKQY